MIPEQESLVGQLRSLMELQKIDSQAYRIRVELAALPGQKSRMEALFEAKKSGLKRAEEDLRHIQARQKELENDILSKETAIRKFESQQNQVKTNQEYTALTHEITNAKSDKSLLEDEVLRIMDETEAKKRDVDAEKKSVAVLEDTHRAEIGKIEAKDREMRQKIEAFEAQRKRYTKDADPELLAQYELILSKRDGLALVPLEGESCGGCSVSMPPQVVNEVKLREKLIFCESCGRILFEAGSE